MPGRLGHGTNDGHCANQINWYRDDTVGVCGSSMCVLSGVLAQRERGENIAATMSTANNPTVRTTVPSRGSGVSKGGVTTSYEILAVGSSMDLADDSGDEDRYMQGQLAVSFSSTSVSLRNGTKAGVLRANLPN